MFLELGNRFSQCGQTLQMGEALQIPGGQVAGHHPSRDSRKAQQDGGSIGELGTVSLSLLSEEVLHLAHGRVVVEADIVLEVGKALQDGLDPCVVDPEVAGSPA